MDWRNLECSIKSEARFFSRTAANHLMLIFDGIGELKTRDDRPLVVDAGPGTGFHILYRARVFQSVDKLESALGRPDIHLGSPAAHLAAGGRMNARGISVFYGASSQQGAIAEVRPPVGAEIAVAQFEIIRKLRLLDLTALGDVRVTGSLTDFGLIGRKEVAEFLRSLSARIARPVMRDDELFEYLATQAIADFLATEAAVAIDGIIFPSLQTLGEAFNVVLFHKAARVEPMNVPERTEINTSTGRWTEDGWVEDYEVFEATLPSHRWDDRIEQQPGLADVAANVNEVSLPTYVDRRDDSIRIVPESVEVHRVTRVEVATVEFKVKRHRQTA
jgi:hypothetical protein